MKHFGRAIVKFRIPILLLAIFLMIPSALGYLKTRVNYDILSYLPKNIETMQGQDILEKEFGTGAFSMVVVEGMPMKDVSAMKEKMEKVDHVKNIIWYDSVADITIPTDLLPEKLRTAFMNGDCTMMAVIFDTTMSSDETMDAIEELRKVAGKQAFISGMSAVVTDTKNLSNAEVPIYVALAVALCLAVLMIFMDSFLVPIFFLLSIGMAIVYNMGTNIFMGQISYITQALAAVLQLGVTLDYSIFLWHSYEEQQTNTNGDKKEAMALAIAQTFTSVVSSSITTIAGFVALCFMHFTLGMDLGIVMAKGVAFGVLGCITVLPAMILLADKAIDKTRHGSLLPEFVKIPKFVTKFYPLILVLFAVIWIPAVIGYNGTSVYYDLAGTLPDSLLSRQAQVKLEDNFNMNTTHIVLIDSSLDAKTVEKMCDEIRGTDGIKSVLGVDALVGSQIPRELIPQKLIKDFEDENYEMIMLLSNYKVASDEVNAQCEKLNKIIKSYDPNGMLIGEAPCTKDLIEITDKDFNTVNWVSIGVIAAIILLTFRSLSLPVILVAAIEFAIFINLGIPYYTNTSLPFIASIVIGTIQLGSTVDYAILMTTRYKAERRSGKSRKESVRIAHATSIPSIIVSALSFFAATFGVGLYSKIDMISALCVLMSRGALISMTVVIFVLPSLLLMFDRVIIYTSRGFRTKKNKDTKEAKEAVAA